MPEKIEYNGRESIIYTLADNAVLTLYPPQRGGTTFKGRYQPEGTQEFQEFEVSAANDNISISPLSPDLYIKKGMEIERQNIFGSYILKIGYTPKTNAFLFFKKGEGNEFTDQFIKALSAYPLVATPTPASPLSPKSTCSPLNPLYGRIWSPIPAHSSPSSHKPDSPIFTPK